jgi:hypothetical protein
MNFQAVSETETHPDQDPQANLHQDQPQFIPNPSQCPFNKEVA